MKDISEWRCTKYNGNFIIMRGGRRNNSILGPSYRAFKEEWQFYYDMWSETEECYHWWTSGAFTLKL